MGLISYPPPPMRSRDNSWRNKRPAPTEPDYVSEGPSWGGWFLLLPIVLLGIFLLKGMGIF